MNDLFNVKTAIMMTIAIGFICWVELIEIPRLLGEELKDWEWAPYAVATHVVLWLVAMTICFVAGNVVGRKSVFAIHERLTQYSTAPVITAIKEVTTGKWQSDAIVQVEGLRQGARFGYAAGKVSTGEPVDRDRLFAELSELDETIQHLPGESAEVIDDFKSYMSDLAAKKSRLG